MKLKRKEMEGQIILQPKLSLLDKFRRYPILFLLMVFWIIPVFFMNVIVIPGIIIGFLTGEEITVNDVTRPMQVQDLGIIAVMITVLVLFLVIPLLLFFLVGRFPEIVIGSHYKTMIVGKRQITPTTNDSVVIERSLIKLRQYYSSGSGRRRRRRGYTYHVVWSVTYHPSGQQPLLLARYQMDNGDGFDELAETLAETLHIPLIDKSGSIEEIREPGTTDVFVGDLVKQGKIREYTQVNLRAINATPASEFLAIEPIESGYRVKFLKDPWRLNMIFKILFAILIVFGGGVFIYFGWYLLGEMLNQLGVSTADNPLAALAFGILIPFAIMMIILSFIAIGGGIVMVIVGLVIISGARTWYIVDFTPQKVSSKRRGLLFIPRPLKKFQTRSIERVVVFQYRKADHCVELMSDKGRLPYNGTYVLEDAILLRNIFLTILAKSSG